MKKENVILALLIVVFFMYAAYQEEKSKSEFYLQQSIECSCKLKELNAN